MKAKSSAGLSEADIVEENVKMQVANVTASEVIQEAWAAAAAKNGDGNSKKSKKNKVYVHGWVYDLETGRLRDLGVSRGARASADSRALN